MTNKPYTTPETTHKSNILENNTYLDKIAKLQRWLMLSLVGLFTIVPLTAIIGIIISQKDFFGSLAVFLMIGTTISIWIAVFQITKLMEGTKSAIFQLIAVFIPFLNIIIHCCPVKDNLNPLGLAYLAG